MRSVLLVTFAMILVLVPSAAYSQDSSPRFEVASIKLAPPPDGPFNINLGAFQGGRLTFSNVTLFDLLMFAHNLPSKAMLAGLDWNDSVRFNIEALAPADTPYDRLRPMVRQLLDERVHLVTRLEPRTMGYVALVVAKGGPKLKVATEAPMPRTQLPGQIEHKRMPMSLLVSLLSRFERQLIVDQTGLTGFYDVKLEWTQDNVVNRAEPPATPTDRPGLSTALEEQLGLRLEGRRGPLDVMVVQAASRIPDEN